MNTWDSLRTAGHTRAVQRSSRRTVQVQAVAATEKPLTSVLAKSFDLPNHAKLKVGLETPEQEQ